jgi:hypothetical protein
MPGLRFHAPFSCTKLLFQVTGVLTELEGLILAFALPQL